MSRVATVTTAIVLASTFGLAQVRPKLASNEPFRSFQLIDRQLSTLNASVGDLTRGNLDSTQRTRAMRAGGLAVSVIQRRSRELASMYRGREPFGYRMFVGLSRRATAVRQALKTTARFRSADERLVQANSELVREFQRISANYGDTHCARGHWACCQPKHDPDEQPGSPNSCKWACVAARPKCSGFLGLQAR